MIAIIATNHLQHAIIFNMFITLALLRAWGYNELGSALFELKLLFILDDNKTRDGNSYPPVNIRIL